jgi:hypothetical protein
MNKPSQRQEAFDAWWARVLLFQQRRFPADWATVANGVGLVSLVMSSERVFLDMAGHWNPVYLRRTGMAQATASDLYAMRASLDRALPTLPPAPRTYFE